MYVYFWETVSKNDHTIDVYAVKHVHLSHYVTYGFKLFYAKTQVDLQNYKQLKYYAAWSEICILYFIFFFISMNVFPQF